MEPNTSLSPTYAQLAILSMRYTKQKPDKIQHILYKKSLKLRHEYQLDILSDDRASSYDEEPTYISEHLSTYILLKFQNVFGIFTSNIFTILYFRMILISRPTQSPQILLRISERSSKSTFTFQNVFRIRNCFGF